jgi:hypothetical protein
MNPLILLKKRHSCYFSSHGATVFGFRVNRTILAKPRYFKSRQHCRSQRRVATPVAILLMMFLASCLRIDPLYKIPDICTRFEAIPLTNLTAPDPNDATWPRVGFEKLGQIKVMHGFGSANLDSGKRMIRVEQSAAVPGYANKATVFLNGWRVSYLGGDQNVAELGALITKINFEPGNPATGLPGKLMWNALGELRDQDFKEGYSFTYYYTIIAWNELALNLIVDHSDCAAAGSFPNNGFIVMNKEKTALLSFSSYIQNPTFPVGKSVAVLPRGFGLSWAPDHQLLQVAYNLDHSEIFLEGGKRYIRNTVGQKIGDTPIGEVGPLPTDTSRVNAGFVSWDTFTIFKDDSDHEEYLAAELVSTLSGNEVGLIQPPFVIQPREGKGAAELGGVARTQDYRIENIPFEIAIPMLTGWELRYYTTDQQVKDLGIWIDQWSYTPGPSGGTLTYTLGSDLADDDHVPDYIDRHRITVLGIGPIAGGGVLRKAAP